MSDKNIIIRDGLKYIKRKNGNKLRLICIGDGCTKNAQIKGGKYYCLKHYSELDNKSKIINEFEDKIKKNNEDKIKKEKEVLENNSQIINGIKIYLKNDKKYRMNANNTLMLVCSFENCTAFGKSKYKSLYCHNHKNGTDPNSEERINEAKKIIEKQKESNKNRKILENNSRIIIINEHNIFNNIKNEIEYKNYGSGSKEYCVMNNCNKTIQKNCGNFCINHYKSFGKNDIERNKIIELVKNKFKEKKAMIIADANLEITKSIKIMNGLKYIKGNDGNSYRICNSNNCTKYANSISDKYYCIEHYNELENKQESINKLKSKYDDIKNENKINEQIELQKNSIIIDNIIIYIKNNKKYRLHGNKLNLICMYDNCITNRDSRSGNYCAIHKNGTSHDHPDKIRERENAMHTRKENGKYCTQIGDATEIWLCNILKIYDSIHSVKRIGQTGSKFDIIYKCINKNAFRGIQVKTLIKNSRYDNSYSMNLPKYKYKKDTLIIGINQERNRFVLFFNNNLSECLTFPFNNKNAKYKNNMYDSPLKFIYNLEKLLKLSSIYDGKNDISLTSLQERNSLSRIENNCKKIRLFFKENDTHNSPIDCYINNFNIQCKTSTSKSSQNNYVFNISKNNGTITNKRTHVPYSDKDDIDFFIFEIISDINTFYIIPIKEMIKKGCVKTNNQLGKLQIHLPTLNNKEHWAHKYLNNFELLIKNEFYDLILNKNKK